jgi:hypothetical protein
MARQNAHRRPPGRTLRDRVRRRSRRVLRTLSVIVHPERRNLASALRAAGVRVQETPGWRTRRAQNRFVPVGTMLHDTGNSGSLEVIVDGRPDLPGPLANLFITKDGVVHLVSAGCCHHAGPGSSVVLKEIQAGCAPTADAAARDLVADIGGNRFFYGIEVQNLSDGMDPYPDEQVEAIIGACVAIRMLHRGWTGVRELHHREWTPTKQDMRLQLDVRAHIAARNRSQPRRSRQR